MNLDLNCRYVIISDSRDTFLAKTPQIYTTRIEVCVVARKVLGQWHSVHNPNCYIFATDAPMYYINDRNDLFVELL